MPPAIRSIRADTSGRYSLISSVGISVLQDFRLLSLSTLCVSFPPFFMRYLRTCRTIVIAVTFHEVDHAPDTEACTECNNECLKYAYCAVEKCHILLRNQRDLYPGQLRRYPASLVSFLHSFLCLQLPMWVTCRDLFDRELWACKKHCPFVPPSDIKKALCFETEGSCPTLLGCQLTSSGFTTVYRSSGFKVSL